MHYDKTTSSCRKNVTAYLKKLSCCLLDLNAGRAMLTKRKYESLIRASHPQASLLKCMQHSGHDHGAGA